MDVETAKAIQDLAKMIDHVNSTKSLGGLALHLSIISLCSQRQNNMLTQKIENSVEEVLTEYNTITNGEPYEKSRQIFLKVREMWDASKPQV